MNTAQAATSGSTENTPIVASSPTFGAIRKGLMRNDLREEDWPLSVKVSVELVSGINNSPQFDKTPLKLAETRVHKRG